MELWAAEAVFDSGAGQDALLWPEQILRKRNGSNFLMRAALGLLIFNEI